MLPCAANYAIAEENVAQIDWRDWGLQPDRRWGSVRVPQSLLPSNMYWNKPTNAALQRLFTFQVNSAWTTKHKADWGPGKWLELHGPTAMLSWVVLE